MFKKVESIKYKERGSYLSFPPPIVVEGRLQRESCLTSKYKTPASAGVTDTFSTPSGSSGFTLVELMVTVGIFVFMTALVVVKYGSFNDGTLLTSMAYDVALTLRDAQSYGLNVQGYTPSSGLQNFNNPYGIHFSSASGSNHQMTLFSDLNNNGVYSGNPSDVITTYTLTNGGIVSSLCVGTGPGVSACPPLNLTTGTLDITFKRPDPNAIITANSVPASTLTYAYAEIKVENASKTSTRTIVVRETGEIAVQNQ